MSEPRVSPADSEELAKKAVQDYLDACQITHRDQIPAHMVKLCSVACTVMVGAVGAPETAASLIDSACHQLLHDVSVNPLTELLLSLGATAGGLSRDEQLYALTQIVRTENLNPGYLTFIRDKIDAVLREADAPVQSRH